MRVNHNGLLLDQVLNSLPQRETTICRVPGGLIEVVEKIRFMPMRKWVWQWTNLREAQEQRNLGEDGTQWFRQWGELPQFRERSSLPLVLSLLDRCGRIDRSSGGGDLWCGVCPRCRCVNDLSRGRPRRQMNRRSRRVDVCNNRLQRILLPRAATAATAVVVDGAAATTVAAGRGLLGICRECGEVATPQRTLCASASLDQCNEGCDGLDAKQSPGRWLCPFD